MKRVLAYTAVIILILVTGLIAVAFRMEKSIQMHYWSDFNKTRVAKGIYPLVEAQDTITETWNNILPDNKLTKWEWILTNEEIATSSNFVYDSIKIRPYHHSKTIYYGTHLFFWKNFYGGEIDVFVNPVSSDTTIDLTIVYYSENLSSRDFFYANIDTLYPNKPNIFVCGTVFENDTIQRIPKGNISKHDADRIIMSWGIK